MAIASIFFAGTNAFMLKIMAERNYDKEFIFFIRYIIGSFLAWVLYFSTTKSFIGVFSIIGIMLFIWLIKAVASYFVSYFKVHSLENIDATLFFPLYKTFTLIAITSSSILLFWEWLDNKEIIALSIWFIVPILLVNKKEGKKQTNLQQGIKYIFLAGAMASFSATINKYVNILDFNIELFSFIFLSIGIFVSHENYRINKKRKRYIYVSEKELIWFSILMWVLIFWSTYTFIKALSWNLAVVYTINSFSILIPIILSVIFYKEEMTYKKAFVIFLSIVSVILFI